MVYSRESVTQRFQSYEAVKHRFVFACVWVHRPSLALPVKSKHLALKLLQSVSHTWLQPTRTEGSVDALLSLTITSATGHGKNWVLQGGVGSRALTEELTGPKGRCVAS